MKKFLLSSLALIIILGLLFVLYFDIFNLRYSKEAELASIISAEDRRQVSTSLLESLSNPDPDIRARAALAIGRIGNLNAVEQLFKLFDDSSDIVVENALFSIGISGNKEFATRLLDNSEKFSPELLALAVQAVGRLADSSMTDVIDNLTDYLSDVDHRVREQAAYALWRANAKNSADRLTEICRNDPVRPVQVAALYALVRMGISEPVGLYAEWLPDADPFVRSLALQGLGNSKAEKDIAQVASGLNDRDNNVVSQAISSLGKAATPKALSFLVSRYQRESDERLKLQIIDTFTRLKKKDLIDYVHEDINIDKTADSISYNIDGAGVVYLAEMEKQAAIALIDTLATINNRYLNIKLAQALAEIGGETVKPRLMTLFKDSSSSVRAAAFNSLCTTDSGNIDYYIRSALSDSDFVVQSEAIDKIGEKKLVKYLPQLMTIIQMKKRADKELKRSVIAAAAEFLGEDKAGINKEAEDILYHGVLDKNYLVSYEAAKFYKEKIGTDRTGYINYPNGLFSERKIKSLLNQYRKNPIAKIYTDRGEIELELIFDVAPLTVGNFIKLAVEGFYDGIIFHRVIPNFVVQGGDPRGDGFGGPGYTIRCEYSNLTFTRGSVGMAHSGKDSGGSQFFIALTPLPHLDARYTLFGQVTSGMDIVDIIRRGDTIKHIMIQTEEDK